MGNRTLAFLATASLSQPCPALPHFGLAFAESCRPPKLMSPSQKRVELLPSYFQGGGAQLLFLAGVNALPAFAKRACLGLSKETL